MAKRDGLDYIYVIWQDTESRNNYVIGTLTRNGHYEFAYGMEVEQALARGFTPLVSFPELDQNYQSETVFPAFACRLPDRKRRGIEDILRKYGLTEFDEFEFLKKSGARLPTDTLSFVDPIFDEEETVERSFFVAGIRHYLECRGCDCASAPGFAEGDQLRLVPEPDNTHDRHAVKIMSQSGEMLGYLPRYYSEAISDRLNKGVNYRCEVVEHCRQQPCSECMKVRLQMPAQ